MIQTLFLLFILQKNFDICLEPFCTFCLFVIQKDFDIFFVVHFEALFNLLELDKDFLELKDTELNGREVKIKREIEELFFKTIIVSTDEMVKFEQQ